jgi:hypothetical protein
VRFSANDRRVRAFLCAAAVALAGGCAPQRPTLAPIPPCTPQPAPTAGWETKREALFAFQIPPGLRYTLVRGIDSAIPTWTGPGLRISYEVGPYAGPALGAPEDARNHLECTELIGGRPAQVAAWNTSGGGMVLHAAWRRIAPAGPFGDTNLAISIHTRSSDPQSQAVAHTILHSVRFPSPPSAP